MMFGLACATNQDTLLGKKYKTKLGTVERTRKSCIWEAGGERSGPQCLLSCIVSKVPAGSEETGTQKVKKKKKSMKSSRFLSQEDVFHKTGLTFTKGCVCTNDKSCLVARASASPGLGRNRSAVIRVHSALSSLEALLSTANEGSLAWSQLSQVFSHVVVAHWACLLSCPQ